LRRSALVLAAVLCLLILIHFSLKPHTFFSIRTGTPRILADKEPQIGEVSAESYGKQIAEDAKSWAVQLLDKARRFHFDPQEYIERFESIIGASLKKLGLMEASIKKPVVTTESFDTQSSSPVPKTHLNRPPNAPSNFYPLSKAVVDLDINKSWSAGDITFS
jgi:hypothetical protein